MKLFDMRVLIVDDDPAILRVYAKALTAHGWAVETAVDAERAIEMVTREAFDVIVSDIAMPGMNGVAFLAAIREHDLDVPVILLTGEPMLDSAVRAVEWGAFRYLTKPISPRDLEDTVHLAAKLHRMGRLRREALEAAGAERRRLGDRAGLEARFALASKMFWIAYQPIVALRAHDVFGYEALLRSYEPTMRSARAILDAADRLGRILALGRATRARVAEEIAGLPSGSSLFLNIHPLELSDDDLLDPDAPLSRVAKSVVLEITERASLEQVRDVLPRVEGLRKMGFRIALDDLGSGYSGMTTYARLEPEIVKLDMSLVRNIEQDTCKQRIVRSMVDLCKDLGTSVIAEGVETVAERDTLASVGCDLHQGYLYAKPARGFVEPSWGAPPRAGANGLVHGA